MVDLQFGAKSQERSIKVYCTLVREQESRRFVFVLSLQFGFFAYNIRITSAYNPPAGKVFLLFFHIYRTSKGIGISPRLLLIVLIQEGRRSNSYKTQMKIYDSSRPFGFFDTLYVYLKKKIANGPSPPTNK